MLWLDSTGSARPLPAPASTTWLPELRHPRPRVAGKFLFRADEKLWIRGVTYGTFRPDAAGDEFHDRDAVERDFRHMAANGLNAIRTYTVPPRFMLDAALRRGLRVMVGLPWEQHVTVLDDPARMRLVEARVRAGVRACAGHPAVLCYVVGNEIPAGIVRWHGARRVERFLHRLYRAAKAEDPGGLVTYVNYPSTEYLDLPFLDLVCFNVYLESQERLDAYLARLQNLAGERPLVMGEIGLDSRRHGAAAQAHVLDWQLRTTFAAGCAGAFVFSWTDEWHRGGQAIEDWDFGLTRRDRRPKPALAAVREAMAAAPFPKEAPWPRISVVVCTYNGARTLADCLDGLLKLEYPCFEVIVVNDGSTDATESIARRWGFRTISTPNQGLGMTRNLGLAAATGEIVAYIDDDARPDPHWLSFLAATFLGTTHAAVGGPNIAPAGDGPVADCVARAPGGPIHVLVGDREAEHIPGCNMAFRKSALEAIGGFDPRFRTAGDDVDVCWRLQAQGFTVGFHAAAVVWHHRRNSVRAYVKQQVGYGRAEALLEQKWPEKYNAAGHLTWAGRLYGNGITRALAHRRGRIYHGQWGSALFQSVYAPAQSALAAVPLMPEWWLVVGLLAVLSGLSAAWSPLRLALPLLGLAVAAPLVVALRDGLRASASDGRSPGATPRWRLLTAVLHLVQPIARLRGRLQHGLTPWRRRSGSRRARPWSRRSSLWSERWRSTEQWLRAVETALRARAVSVARGCDWSRWDLGVRGGLLGGARMRAVVEEHGAGRQLVRFGSWPRLSSLGVVLTVTLAFLAGWAIRDRAATASLVLGLAAMGVAGRALLECGWALGALADALGDLESHHSE